MKKSISIILFFIFTVLSLNTYSKEYPKTYPFFPESTQNLHQKVSRLAEDDDIMTNIFEINKRELHNSKATNQPWTASYWPITKGIISYQYPNNVFTRGLEWTVMLPRLVSWSANMRRLKKSLGELKSEWKALSSDELELLSPTAKYDILIGDESFDLTSRVIKYVFDWAKLENRNLLITDNLDEKMIKQIAENLIKKNPTLSKDSAFLDAKAIFLAEKDNYVLQKKDEFIALWEGICHGWAAAATVVPRPRKFVDFTLKDGRNLRFFPEDIKALISYSWASSKVQLNNSSESEGKVIFEGNRCDFDSPLKDEWGRNYDPVNKNFPMLPEYGCSGVHPAVWHLSLINLIGKQGRSFIADVDIVSKVNNHPVSGYEMTFFNPYTGKYLPFSKAVQDYNWSQDQFRNLRNLNITKKLVGVKLKVNYIDYDSPKRELTNSEEDDDSFSRTMLYDLEIDEQGNIIGGQWRTTEVGKSSRDKYRNMPDTFWVISKNWKNTFKNLPLTGWDKRSSPPNHWIKEAKQSHRHTKISPMRKCKYEHSETKEVLEVNCQTMDFNPIPLKNIVNGLIELSQ